LLAVEERRVTVNIEIEYIPLGLATQDERGLAGAVHFIPLVLHRAATPVDGMAIVTNRGDQNGES
jgi:hypothetical protein